MSWVNAVLTATECLLKAENYSVAARLDPSNARLPVYLRLAALWRARAVELQIGGRIELMSEPDEEWREPIH